MGNLLNRKGLLDFDLEPLLCGLVTVGKVIGGYGRNSLSWRTGGCRPHRIRSGDCRRKDRHS